MFPAKNMYTKAIVIPNDQFERIKSTCGHFDEPADRLNWLLSKILSPLLQCISAHLSSAADILRNLASIIPDERTHMESFDVEAEGTMNCLP